MRLHHSHIATRQTARIHSTSLQSRHYSLVSQASVSHNGNIQCSGIGNATTLVHLNLHAQLCSELRAHNSATVYQDERLVKRSQAVT